MKSAKRKLPDFIEAYKQFHKGVSGPEQFKEWAALWAVSAALERKVWTITLESPCYANLFIMLLGPSGCGKGVTLRTANTLVGSLGADRLSPSSMTAAYFTQSLSERERSFVNPVTKDPEPYFAMHVHSAEMAQLFPTKDEELFANLTDSWDCHKLSVGRITKDRNFWLDRVCVTALFATNPVHINSLITNNAWHGGFMSRVIIVVGQAPQRGSAFSKSSTTFERNQQLKDLKETLRHISTLQGEYEWEPEAREVFDEFYRYPGNLGGPPIPSHPNLATYCERRHQQLEKIMMCRAASLRDDFILTLEDFNYAKKLLLNTEAVMADAFHGADLDSPHTRATNILYELHKWQLKHKHAYISRTKIYNVIHQKVKFWQEAQHILTFICSSDAVRKVPEEQLTPRQALKDKSWYKILSDTFDEVPDATLNADEEF